jgi:hypothetical protein
LRNVPAAEGRALTGMLEPCNFVNEIFCKQTCANISKASYTDEKYFDFPEQPHVADKSVKTGGIAFCDFCIFMALAKNPYNDNKEKKFANG